MTTPGEPPGSPLRERLDPLGETNNCGIPEDPPWGTCLLDHLFGKHLRENQWGNPLRESHLGEAVWWNPSWCPRFVNLLGGPPSGDLPFRSPLWDQTLGTRLGKPHWCHLAGSLLGDIHCGTPLRGPPCGTRFMAPLGDTPWGPPRWSPLGETPVVPLVTPTGDHPSMTQLFDSHDGPSLWDTLDEPPSGTLL